MFIKKKVLEQQIYITSESTQTRVYTIWQLKKKNLMALVPKENPNQNKNAPVDEMH
jgi:hypothetical protein